MTDADPKSALDELRAARRDNRGIFATVFVFSIFTNLLMLTGPLFMLQVYDRVLASRAEETLVALFGLVAALYLIYGILDYARGRVMARAGARFQSRINTRVFDAALEQAAMRKGARGGGQALSALEAIRNFYTSPMILALYDIPWTPVFLAAIFIFHPMLGWLAVVGGGILIIAAALNQILTRTRQQDAGRLQYAATTMASEAEDGAEVIWSQGMGQTMTRRWLAVQTAAMGRAIGAADWTGSFTSFTKAFRLFLQSAVLALGAWLVLQNELTAGAMIAASILLGRALAPVEQGLSQWPIAQRARQGWATLRDFLEKLPARPNRTALPAPVARLSVRDLSVARQAREKPLLSQVGFDVSPGEALGIIGKSGSGKTTLARTIVGLVRPTQGEVRLGGATLDQYGPERLGGHIGYLPQDVRLFDGTIAENIARMTETPDAQKVIAAAQAAQVHDVVLALPDGYDTPIAATDAQLSGGQKQRLALARALYGAPVLLVLDEPNSALDADGSMALNAAIESMKADGKAVLIMTHRPTAISTCDRLLVLDGGRVSGYGPRDEIVKSMMKNASAVQKVTGQGGAA